MHFLKMERGATCPFFTSVLLNNLILYNLRLGCSYILEIRDQTHLSVTFGDFCRLWYSRSKDEGCYPFGHGCRHTLSPMDSSFLLCPVRGYRVEVRFREKKEQRTFEGFYSLLQFVCLNESCFSFDSGCCLSLSTMDRSPAFVLSLFI